MQSVANTGATNGALQYKIACYPNITAANNINDVNGTVVNSTQLASKGKPYFTIFYAKYKFHGAV